jgi:hypothetical protein
MRAPASSEQIVSRRPGVTQLFCVTLLVAASLCASLLFACATPFAAFAVLSAAMLPLRPALVTIGAVWLVNQAIGFGLLGYPMAADAAMWGLTIGVAALVATAVAVTVMRRLHGIDRFAAYPVALVASFAAYELCLWAMTPVLGGAEAFALDIVGRLAFLNAAWLAGLVGVHETASLIDPRTRRQALRRTSA